MKNIFQNKGPHKPVSLFVLFFICVQFFATASNAQEETGSRLVTTAWLQKNLGDPGIVLLDASTSPSFAANHIPGAINYDIFTYGVKEFPVEEIEKRYRSWGISPDKKIVLYDQGGSYLATRLFFSLEYYGFPANQVFILDGGFAKWKAAGLPVTNKPTAAPANGTFSIKQLNRDIRVDLPEFLEASGNTADNVLLEALDPAWHFGTNQFFGRPGHIPNAIMLPAEDFYNTDKTFKSPEEIKKILTYLGIGPEKKVLSHCGGGIAASVPFFALKYLLGYANVKLFPGSLLEWASDQRELPLWTYDAPYLMRNAAWLQGWGGRMMRMYGMSNLSFIDIRPADAFGKGHVQYAVNIPATVFRENIHDPGKLAGVLAAAGVQPSQEAVILTGGGLTKEAALAFVLLEKLGQKKISLFMDLQDEWAASGFTIQKDTMATGAVNVQPGKTAAGTNYTVNLRKDIIISDPNSAQGIYPKVFIASGKQVPGKSPSGTIVHIPFTELLQADGRPKAAKDIWNILSKAGVPRYAELICFSDDPGEAAVNYFILKLMGVPDRKLLAVSH